jgi:hypothetical protein
VCLFLFLAIGSFFSFFEVIQEELELSWVAEFGMVEQDIELHSLAALAAVDREVLFFWGFRP